jgi:D-glycero-alpha-D-manno-heptose 1-phosphate guanylyltransferase
VECIVLAGGLGTRLQSTIGAMPKCMAMVAGQPFLFHLFRYLETQKCTRVILSLGYMHQMVENWLIATDWEFEIEIVIEKEPLGTGGGIALAMQKARAQHVFVLNGDTMFLVDLNAMSAFHSRHKSCTTLALKSMEHFERYGLVEMDERHCVQSFQEKKFYDHGLINGGVYIIDKMHFEEKNLGTQFSFEKDYLERFVFEKLFFGFETANYFIDIGVPEDYAQAQIDFVKTEN